jgi:ABC-type Fe3+/spermidine/putrescine transport system ATPase subunit
MTSGVVLQLVEVSKLFGQVRAVDGVSIEVMEGEVLTLLGPSGCGKTTTLRMVIGLERCSEGEIIYQGQVVDSAKRRVHVPTHKRQMGMVFQSYAIWPHMTVFENVAYPLHVRKVRRAEVQAAVNRVIDLVGLTGLADRPATMLSGGQQQRVALARSLVFEPKILLLDEPFSNLDAKLREQMRVELRVLQRRLGITVLFVTHDQVEALSLSDRIAVMNAGHVEQIGTPNELYLDPRTPSVRDFLGRTIILKGRVVEARDARTVAAVVGDGSVSEVDGTRPHLSPLPAGEGAGRGEGIVLVSTVDDSDRLQVGQVCYLAVRPELVDVSADGSAAAENSVQGVVEALLFVGERYEARIALPWGESILAYLPPMGVWQEGQRVTLTFPRDRLRAWPG